MRIPEFRAPANHSGEQCRGGEPSIVHLFGGAMHIHGPGALEPARGMASPLPDPVIPRDGAGHDHDGHVMEPAELWVERMDHDKWRDCILGRNAIDAYRLVT